MMKQQSGIQFKNLLTNIIQLQMTKFIDPVSKCHGTEVYFDGEITEYICRQCGKTCIVVEGDEDEISFNKELEKADKKIKQSKEEKS